jgi:crotonobetainyl-CoA:carnitine CoA-transferase CaiB-like acyl-CoA transferase
MDSRSTLPLAGVRVVDLTAVVSGPMATSILADQGADVIKIEEPGLGDLVRYMGHSRGGMAAMYTTINRNKRSIAINLREQAGKELLYRLVATADVFVQNFRPGVADRIGVGEAELRTHKNDLIYVSISGFGPTGPYVHQRVYDVVVQAMSGIAASQKDPATGRPELIRNIVCDKVTAITASQAITAALFQRERDGAGSHVQLSMLDASVAFLWPDGMTADTLLGEGITPSESVAAAMRPYRTRDGYITLLTISYKEFEALARAIDRPDLPSDPRFDTLAEVYNNFPSIMEIVEAFAENLTTRELLDRLEAEDVPCAPVTEVSDVHENPQVLANKLLVEVDHPLAGRLRAPLGAAMFGPSRQPIRLHAPSLGQHTDEVLTELGEDAASIAALREGRVVQ